jgi:hypothetical protein
MPGSAWHQPARAGHRPFAWGTGDPTADLDGSGLVDAADLSFILANWGAGGAGE